MRLKQSAGKQLEALANKAPDEIPQISRDPHLATHINRLYYAYPLFLLARLDERLRAELYLPWEDPEEFEPLRVHLAVTHHWHLEDVRQMPQEKLLTLLRPELMALELSSAEVQSIVEKLDDLDVPLIHEDLKKRGSTS